VDDLLFHLLDEVEDEESFLVFVERLAVDRASAESSAQTLDGFQGTWANQTILQFLEASSAWARDSKFGERPGPKPSNPWRQFAQFLIAGKSYE
jgi:hypothetical protein